MTFLRRSSAAWVAVALTACVASCDRARQRAADSTAGPATPAPSMPASAAAPSTWNADAGPLLLVAGDAPDRALVLVPDSAQQSAELAAIPKQASVTLFGRNGTVQTASLPAVDDSGACVTATLSAAPPPHPWAVGFLGGVTSPIPLDSLDAMSQADSSSLMAAVVRVGTALPIDSAGRFAGLPFTVRSLWRFGIPRRVVVAATLERQINQEATPLEERTLVIAERDSTAPDSTFALTYSDRSYGAEETIESRDVLAAIDLGMARTPTLLVSADFGDAIAYRLIVRGADGHWRVQWRSGRRHCS